MSENLKGVPMTIRLMCLQLACLALLLAPATLHAQRRGAAQSKTVPMTTATIVIGDKRYTGTVDAACGIDERATATTTRAYYKAMYPWFGQRVAPDQPQWRFTLEIQRASAGDLHKNFTFSFLDGSKSATIQTVTYGERMGSGTVRVTRQGAGARFEVRGQSKEGTAVNAVITCSAFTASEGAGG